MPTSCFYFCNHMSFPSNKLLHFFTSKILIFLDYLKTLLHQLNENFSQLVYVVSVLLGISYCKSPIFVNTQFKYIEPNKFELQFFVKAEL